MAINLLDLVKGYLTPDVMQRAASFVGESPSATQSALTGGVPTIIGALSEMASTRTGADQIDRMLDVGKFDGSAVSNPAGFFSTSGTSQSLVDAGTALLGSLFGGKASGVADLIAQSAGMQASAATSLLGLAAGLVMDVLGRQRTSMGLDTAGLASLLGDQRSMIAGLLPTGLSSLLGWTMPAVEGVVSTSYRYVTDSHRPDLGGNIRYGGVGSYTPRTWTWIAHRFAITSMLDVGCGEGHAVAYFRTRGVFSHGIDGLYSNVKRSVIPIALHDLCSGPYIMPVDLTLCIEVAEHLEEKYLSNFLTTLGNGRIIVMTHGLPGQEGHHHVNCQSQEYWIDKLNTLNYEHLPYDSEILRQVASGEGWWTHAARSALIFARRDDGDIESRRKSEGPVSSARSVT